MKSIQPILFLAIILLLSYSCSNKRTRHKDGVYFLDVRAAVSAGKSNAFISGLTQNIRYVPLETTQQSFLQRVNKVVIHKDYLFVSDNQVVLQFDLQGNFIRRIGGIGNGPGEYSGMVRFSVNPLHDEVVVCMPMTQKVLVFDLLTGHFKMDFNIGFFVSDLGVLPNGNLAFFTREVPKGFSSFNVNEVIITDRTGFLTDSVANPGRITYSSNSAGYANAFMHQDNLFYMFNVRDTLWRINSNMEKTPYMVFSPGNTMGGDELDFQATDQVQFPDHVWVSRLVGNQRFLYALVNKGFFQGPPESDPNVNKVVFDKQSGQLFSTSGFANDLDGGMVFWPRWISNGVLIESYLPLQIIEHYQNTRDSLQHGADFLALAGTLDENDNPVLVLVGN